MVYPPLDQMTQGLMSAGYSACALLLTSFCCWSLWNTAREGLRHLRRLHQVPCHRCQYFTGEHWLKCTVHPCRAFSEAAIDCPDFEPLERTRVPAINQSPVFSGRLIQNRR